MAQAHSMARLLDINALEPSEALLPQQTVVQRDAAPHHFGEFQYSLIQQIYHIATGRAHGRRHTFGIKFPGDLNLGKLLLVLTSASRG